MWTAYKLLHLEKQKHCRYCNRTLELDARRCPACKQNQSRAKELVALFLVLLVFGMVAYLQLSRNPTPHPSLPNIQTPNQTTEPKLQSSPDARSRFLFTPRLEQPRTPRTTRTYTGQPTPLRKNARASTKAVSYQGTAFRQQPGDYPYYVAEKKWDPQLKKYEFWRKGMQGSEIPLLIDARRYFLSENQSNYPEPASGCGPTALLNLYIWYSKFGLLQESIRHSDPDTYKQLKFREIDRKLLNIQRASRSRNGGTNTLAAIVTMDELVQEFTRNETRLHFEIKLPPLDRRDFMKLSQGYRAGILSVRPKDPTTGQLMGNHAVLCIRGDTSGMITIANWGEFSHGSLVQRSDGQWFVPRDPSQYELRINQLTTLVPFVPKI